MSASRIIHFKAIHQIQVKFRSITPAQYLVVLKELPEADRHSFSSNNLEAKLSKWPRIA